MKTTARKYWFWDGRGLLLRTAPLYVLGSELSKISKIMITLSPSVLKCPFVMTKLLLFSDKQLMAFPVTFAVLEVIISAVGVYHITLPLRPAAEENYHHSLESLPLPVAGKMFMTEINR